MTYSPTGTAPRTDTITGTYSGDTKHGTSRGTFNLSVVADQPPVASFTESATTAPTGTAISFDASTSHDPDGTIVSYSWNFGDGMTATGATTSHSYTTAGSYTVTLTVTDNSGSTGMSTATKTITDRSPTASFTFTPANPTVGQTVTFDASSSMDPDGTITNYAWDFGDTSTGTGVTTTHAYAAAGTYTVTLTVTDNSGNTGTSSATITVSTQQPGAHVSFFQWSVRPQYKKFSISKQGPIEAIQAFAVNDGNRTVFSYVRFVITGDGGVNTVLYTQVVQLAPGQEINGNTDPRFAASFIPTVSGTYFIQATVYYSASSTPAPIGDPSYTANPNTANSTFVVRP